MAKGKASGGGVTSARDVRGYEMPYGPTSLGNTKVGLGGDNLGNCGSQGQTSVKCSSSGSPGIKGDKMKAGSQR